MEMCSRFRFLAAETECFPMSLIKRAYRSCCYPTSEQRQVLARTFGCCRWVYNQALARKTAAYREAGQRLSYGDLSALLPRWKTQEETTWLREVSRVPCNRVCDIWIGPSSLKGYANPPPAGCAIHCTGVHIWEKDKTLEFR